MRSNVLRAYIKEVLLTEEITPGQSMKVKDVKAALSLLKKYKTIEAAKSAAKNAGKASVSTVLGFIGLGGWDKWAEVGMNVFDASYELYDIGSPVFKNKDKKDNPLIDLLTIDPDTSAIVDDTVEGNFLRYLGKVIQGKNDDDELPDADSMLSDFLKNKFDGHHVAS